jgi:Holliday junction resolvasome RuvABC endonuclease subunit
MAISSLVNRRIVCIDNSTNSTAWAIFEGKKLIESGEIHFPGKDTYERLVNVRTCLEPLRKKCANINELYIEQTTFVQSKGTVILLGLAEGAAISAVAHAGMRIHRVSPLVWQNHIGNPPLTASEKAKLKLKNAGKTASWLKGEMRRVRKQRTIDIVNKRFKLKETSDNVCDAIGIGIWASK